MARITNTVHHIIFVYVKTKCVLSGDKDCFDLLENNLKDVSSTFHMSKNVSTLQTTTFFLLLTWKNVGSLVKGVVWGSGIIERPSIIKDTDLA